MNYLSRVSWLSFAYPHYHYLTHIHHFLLCPCVRVGEGGIRNGLIARMTAHAQPSLRLPIGSCIQKTPWVSTPSNFFLLLLTSPLFSSISLYSFFYMHLDLFRLHAAISASSDRVLHSEDSIIYTSYFSFFSSVSYFYFYFYFTLLYLYFLFLMHYSARSHLCVFRAGPAFRRHHGYLLLLYFFLLLLSFLLLFRATLSSMHLATSFRAAISASSDRVLYSEDTMVSIYFSLFSFIYLLFLLFS